MGFFPYTPVGFGRSLSIVTPRCQIVHARLQMLTPNRERETMVSTEKPELPTEEAAEYIGSTPNTMKRWRSLKKGPPYYRGLTNRILYKRSDLDRWMASRRVDTFSSVAAPVEQGT
jgi:Helix-turn-helix domain